MIKYHVEGGYKCKEKQRGLLLWKCVLEGYRLIENTGNNGGIFRERKKRSKKVSI